MKQAHLVSLLVGSLAVSAAAQPAPRYTNAQLVSVNAQSRQVVIKNTDGKEETLQLDDTVADLGELRAGDRVILTLREEPGVTRVSSIAKSLARATAASAPAPPAPVAVAVVVPASPGLAAFSDRVAAMSQQAGIVDVLWGDFKTTCNAALRSNYPDGRGWFGLWEESGAQMDVTSAPCRDLFNEIIGKGEAVKAGMAQAEEGARKADLAPGDLREVRRRYSMEWGGWGLSAPQPLKQ